MGVSTDDFVLRRDAQGGTDVYELAESFSLSTNRCLFITGRAGTGKTTFLHKLRERINRNLVVVAPTGVAALNAGGMTIHSFFQLPVRFLTPTTASYQQMYAEQRMRQSKRNMIRQLEVLVIDEISMVRADLLDAIDISLRRYKNRHDLPFGGVQVIMIGDLFQLAPVIRGDEEKETLDRYYEGPFFFHSKVFREIQPVYIEFDHIFRQSDNRFIDLLNEIRDNRLTKDGRALLDSRYIPDYKNPEDDFHITLTTHNALANEINSRELLKLDSPSFFFKASINGNFPENIYPTDAVLELKKGTRVMFIRNDDANKHRFYNGKSGIVTQIEEDSIVVQCGEELIDVPTIEWKNVVYRENTSTGVIEEEELGSFVQYPLRLAWAITIHKSQGLTFDKVIIDAQRAFAAGQVYVALSRCRTLEGLVLSSSLAHVNLQNEQQVLDYVNSQPSCEQTKALLDAAKEEYRLKLFIELYQFHDICQLADGMKDAVYSSPSFIYTSLRFIKDLYNRIYDLRSVSEKFCTQLRHILLMRDEVRLKQRLQAACSYFTPLLETLANDISNQPVRCKNKEDALDYMVMTKELFLIINRKMRLMQVIAESPSCEALCEARAQFVAPRMNVTSVIMSGKSEKKPKKPDTPKKPKTDTYALSFQLFMEGNSVEDIAVLRGLKPNTIYTHLTRYVRSGEIDISEFIPDDIIELVRKTKEDNPDVVSSSELKKLTGDEFLEHWQIKMVLASMEKNDTSDSTSEK